MVRSLLFLIVVMVSACTRGDQEANAAAPQPAAVKPADLSSLEIKAIELYQAQQKSAHQQEQLLAATKKAMASTLFDPFSAHYQKVHAGRNGAICGEVNAKNRMGAYIGFKKFVIPRDRSTVYVPESGGGFTAELYSAFTRAYIASCANQREVSLYNVLTMPMAPAPSPVSDDPPLGNTI